MGFKDIAEQLKAALDTRGAPPGDLLSEDVSEFPNKIQDT
jgi:hypothetical protein